MGNFLTKETRNQMESTVDKIIDTECENLLLGNRQGSTGYIDFIIPEEFDGNIAKGYDCHSRGFIVFKCELVYEDGTTQKNFTIFFQRYYDDKTTWHTAGYYKNLLFDTQGGATLSQMEFILKLLTDGFVIFDDNNLHQNNFYWNKYDEQDKQIYPVKVQLGFTI